MVNHCHLSLKKAGNPLLKNIKINRANAKY